MGSEEVGASSEEPAVGPAVKSAVGPAVKSAVGSAAVVAAPLRETWARSSSPPVTERVTPATSETTAQTVSSA